MAVALPPISWTIDGEDVRVERDWTSTANRRGPESFRGAIAERDVRRGLQIEQGAPIYGWKPNGRPLFSGRVLQNPTIEDGRYQVVAVGPQDHFAKAFRRLLFQSRDYQLVADAQAAPHNYTDFESISGENTGGSLRWRIEANEAVTQNDRHSFVLWAPGALITRVAYDWGSTLATTNLQLRTLTGVGPNDPTRTVENTHSLNATSGSVDEPIAVPEDMAFVELIRNGATTAAHARYRVTATNLRFNGIAPGDSYTAAQVLTYIAGTELGLDTTQIAATAQNVLPLDVIDEDYASVADRMALLEDAYWHVTAVNASGWREGVVFAPWSSAPVWYVDAGTARAEGLAPQPKFNQVVGEWVTPAGRPMQVAVSAYVRELDERGLVKQFKVAIPDAAADATLITSYATATLNRLIEDRYAGSFDVVQLWEQDALRGGASPYDLTPNTVLVEQDAGPRRETRHRVAQVSYGERSVTASVEDVLDTIRMIELAGLERARAYVRPYYKQARRRTTASRRRDSRRHRRRRG